MREEAALPGSSPGGYLPAPGGREPRPGAKPMTRTIERYEMDEKGARTQDEPQAGHGALAVEHALALYPNAVERKSLVLTIYSHDGTEFVIASSPEDAAAVYKEQCGEGAARALDDAPGIAWKAHRGDSLFKLCEEEGGPFIERTCSEWDTLRGRCYLGSYYS